MGSPPATPYDPHPPRPPSDFCVAAVDGSHIDVDRHLPVKCCLINIGSCVLTYGSTPNAVLVNHPRLYASDEELKIRSHGQPYQEQAIQGAVLGVLRAVEEMKGLVEAVRHLPQDLPTLALMDGTLIMFLGRGTPDFVIEELVCAGIRPRPGRTARAGLGPSTRARQLHKPARQRGIHERAQGFRLPVPGVRLQAPLRRPGLRQPPLR